MSITGINGCCELNPSIELRDHPIKVIGKGLFAGKPMKKGEVVWRMNGVAGVYHTLADVTGANETMQNFFLHYGYQTGEGK